MRPYMIEGKGERKMKLESERKREKMGINCKQLDRERTRMAQSSR